MEGTTRRTRINNMHAAQNGGRASSPRRAPILAFNLLTILFGSDESSNSDRWVNSPRYLYIQVLEGYDYAVGEEPPTTFVVREDFDIAICGATENERATIAAEDNNLEVEFDPGEQMLTIREVVRPPDSTDNTSHRAILTRLNKRNCHLAKLKESPDGEFQLSIRIFDNKKAATENHQQGFVNHYVPGVFETVMAKFQKITSLEISLYTEKMPWRLNAAVILRSLGMIPLDDYHRMMLIHQRLDECEVQLRHYGQLISANKGLEQLEIEAMQLLDSLEHVDTPARRELLFKYRIASDQVALVKGREQWQIEEVRLKKEHKGILEPPLAHGSNRASLRSGAGESNEGSSSPELTSCRGLGLSR
ncbi:hypothetical protein AJ80_08268 [Polytolypa hystricis UAMH7299]|uniref:Uncharacterized protein n=1 Tax=Polytolypa hystricis (strain UAMH7299) TaxID=1447883 RepID=A0A2B7XAB3_POLH7|nr:hypothetical protein AJ80_08268 [Polytolypa hystricis UAMH7299]